jgi:hypothetical protein
MFHCSILFREKVFAMMKKIQNNSCCCLFFTLGSAEKQYIFPETLIWTVFGSIMGLDKSNQSARFL